MQFCTHVILHYYKGFDKKKNIKSLIYSSSVKYFIDVFFHSCLV